MNNLQKDETLGTISSSNKLIRAIRFSFPFFLFLVAFFPRALRQVETYALWHTRGEIFIDALLRGAWSETLIAPHPGVITMWLSGLTQKIASVMNANFEKLSSNEQMAIELIPMAIVISLTIVLAFFLMAKIFDWQVAAVATLLLALDPYHITLSKAIHVDALVSVFAMISALFLWAYVGEQRKTYIALSGVFAALALLTKTPGIFLVPYLILVIGTWLMAKLFVNENQIRLPNRNQFWRSAKILLVVVFIWFMAFAAAFYLFWPSMWSQPSETLQTLFGGTNFYRRTPHENPIFFLGKATMEDPGPWFYPYNMVVKTTAVSLVGFLMSIPLIFNRNLERNKRLAIVWGLAFIVFFIVMMTLGEKKFGRYALPALQFVVLLAGVGLVYFFRWITKGNKLLLTIALVAVILLQAAVSLPRHPYYGTHYNYLAGGPKSVLERGILAGQEKAEGMEIAADYLNNLPLSPLLVVGAQTPGSFGLHFNGKTVEMTDEEVDYLVFTRSWILRKVQASQWQELWESYKDRSPKLVVEFDGVPYVWVFKTGPVIRDQNLSHTVHADLGEDFRLLGYDFHPMAARPGDMVRLTLYWESLRETDADYTVFNHMLDSNGQLYGQIDNQPQGGMYPTYLWEKHERIVDEYEFIIAADAPEGHYDFAVGMYELETLERLPISTQSGQPAPDNRLILPGPTVTRP